MNKLYLGWSILGFLVIVLITGFIISSVSGNVVFRDLGISLMFLSAGISYLWGREASPRFKLFGQSGVFLQRAIAILLIFCGLFGLIFFIFKLIN